MKNFGFTTAITIALLMLCVIQFVISASFNDNFGQEQYDMPWAKGTLRWADDSDGPLMSSAQTEVWLVWDWNDEVEGDILSYNWFSYAWAHYSGDDDDYEGSYSVKAVANGVTASDSGTFVGELDAYRDMYVMHSPPGDDDELDIEDCSARGFAKRTGTIRKGEEHETQAKIPFKK